MRVLDDLAERFQCFRTPPVVVLDTLTTAAIARLGRRQATKSAVFLENWFQTASKNLRRLCRFDVLGKSAGQDRTVVSRVEGTSGTLMVAAICRQRGLEGAETAGMS